MVSVKVMFLNFAIATIIIATVISHDFGYSQVRVNNVRNESIDNATRENEGAINLIFNPNFTLFNDTSKLPTYWSDSLEHCRTIFSCIIQFTDGWNDYVSVALSTTNNTNKTWSSLYGKPIEVYSSTKYQLVSHMKLNNWAMQSHIAVEALNESSSKWYQIAQCPSGINGPLEWHEFTCEMTIPSNITKIRPVLNAGWSSQPNKEATTWFDSMVLTAKIPMVKSTG